MQCTSCGSLKFRVSRLRLSDCFQLFLFRYPVRCRICNSRVYESFLKVLELHRANKLRHQQKHVHSSGEARSKAGHR